MILVMGLVGMLACECILSVKALCSSTNSLVNSLFSPKNSIISDVCFRQQWFQRICAVEPTDVTPVSGLSIPAAAAILLSFPMATLQSR